MNIVVFLKEDRKGTEILVGEETLAELLCQKFQGKIVEDEAGWIIKTDLPVSDVAKILEKLELPQGKIDVHYFDIMLEAKNAGKGVARCPICGSTNIHLSTLSGWLTPQLYVCEDCGYIGRFILIVEESEKKNEDEPFKRRIS